MKGSINITIPVWLIAVVFIILKLTHIIAWSWLWVLSPIWLPFAIVIGAWVLIILIGEAIAVHDWINTKWW